MVVPAKKAAKAQPALTLALAPVLALVRALALVLHSAGDGASVSSTV